MSHYYLKGGALCSDVTLWQIWVCLYLVIHCLHFNNVFPSEVVFIFEVVFILEAVFIFGVIFIIDVILIFGLILFFEFAVIF